MTCNSTGPNASRRRFLAQVGAGTCLAVLDESARAEKMKAQLKAWQESVARSLEGKDYR